MTRGHLEQLEDDFWSAADNLRANSDLKASEYGTPVLGLIFLKFSDINYRRYEDAIQEEFLTLIDRYFAAGMERLAENKAQVEPVSEKILEVVDAPHRPARKDGRGTLPRMVRPHAFPRQQKHRVRQGRAGGVGAETVWRVLYAETWL